MKAGGSSTCIAARRVQAPSVPSVRSVIRAADILKAFVDRPSLTLAEAASATALDRGTTRRLLLTLAAVGFVVQDGTTQRYRLGRTMRELGAAVPEDLDLRSRATPVLAELAAALHATALLSIYVDHSAICLERLHDTTTGMAVRWWRIGGTLELNCGAAPKLLLAYQPREEIDRVLRQRLSALTPRSIVNPAALRRRLALIVKRGWELAVDDVVLGLSALAAPIRNAGGTVIGAVSIAGLTPQIAPRGKPAHLAPLLAAAETISARSS